MNNDNGEIKLEKAKISVHQLYVLVVFYVVVSAIIIAYGVENKQDAWISTLVGTLGGILLFLMNVKIYSYFPGHSFGEVIQFIFGKWLGKLVTILYMIYFMYLSAFVLRDFSELVRVFAYQNTPMLVISSFMLV
ncbi:MAG: GerAB/ArcD/ProY family transporter, partial [Paenibacillus sp.]|nr:GerAB/ArcD/ProY family transporter [Paenibacillus sp.]